MVFLILKCFNSSTPLYEAVKNCPPEFVKILLSSPEIQVNDYSV